MKVSRIAVSMNANPHTARKWRLWRRSWSRSRSGLRAFLGRIVAASSSASSSESSRRAAPWTPTDAGGSPTASGDGFRMQSSAGATEAVTQAATASVPRHEAPAAMTSDNTARAKALPEMNDSDRRPSTRPCRSCATHCPLSCTVPTHAAGCAARRSTQLSVSGTSSPAPHTVSRAVAPALPKQASRKHARPPSVSASMPYASLPRR